MRLARHISAVSAALVAAMAAVGVAAAQTNICVDLEARLVQLDRGTTPGGDPRQYDAPIEQQRNEIDRAMAEARRAGCVGGFLFFQKTPEAKCGKLMPTIDKMNQNLRRLMEARGQFEDNPYTLARERSDILNQLAYNRCGPNYASNDQSYQPQSGGLFATLFGVPRIRTYGEDAYSPDGNFGTYRTLCVRTCDGFYFPISFSTVPGQFPADEATCQAMCPGAESELFTYRNPGEDVDQMVSLSGQPYSALPNAFRYRTSYDKTCTCHPANASVAGSLDLGGAATAAPLDPTNATPVTPAAVPLPRIRPAPGEDPETIAVRAGNFVPAPITPADDDGTTTASADGQRKIRIVGPTSYYGQ